LKGRDNVNRPRLISKEQRESRKERREAEARVAMAENAKAAKEFAKNRERLKAERLAREDGEAIKEAGLKAKNPK
jgi:hypothetical protein